MKTAEMMVAFGLPCVFAVAMAAAVAGRLVRHARATASPDAESSRRGAMLAFVLLLGGLVSLVVLIGFGVPSAAQILAEMGSVLPASTRFALACSDAVQHAWFVVLPAVGSLLGGVFVLRFLIPGNRIAARAADWAVTGAMGFVTLIVAFVMWGVLSPLVGMATRLS